MSKTEIEWCDYDKGWIEAFVDSEGWLSLIREKRASFKAGYTYKPILGVSNKNRAMIDKARFLLGASNQSWQNGNGVLMLALTSNKLRSILPKLTLIAKKRQRVLLLEALDILAIHRGKNEPRTDTEIDRLENIYLALKSMNAMAGGK